MRYLAGFVGAILIFLIAGALVVWLGLYNFAASEAHPGAVRSAIDTALHNSVARRARGLQAPQETREGLREGAREFIEYCVHCHGAPGVEPHEWASGMRPNPPDLARAANDWSTEQVFWIVKHGIRMTGMPPFGDSESDETIWRIAAFVKRLPQIDAPTFARLDRELGSEPHRHGGAE